MSLNLYQEKRNFSKTPEPKGEQRSSTGPLRFVIQKHDASQLHYDFRLEMMGLLKSWAVPKGPSLNPSDKRLAMEVEDHPFDYRDFEGVIPEGSYGAGTVIVWDEGVYVPVGGEELSRQEQEKMLMRQFFSGTVKFTLQGQKVGGSFTLIRLKKGVERSWLLIKSADEFSSSEDITLKDRSVKSGRTLEEVAREHGKTLRHPEEKEALPKRKIKKAAAAKAAPKASRAKTTAPKKGVVVHNKNFDPAEGRDQLLVVNRHELTITSLDKLYWKNEGITKGQMLRYYSEVAPFLLPYLKNRPQSLHRYPNGISGQHFFQKDVAGKVPDWMKTHADFSESTGETVHYLVCTNEATLLYMANLGCIELHPWHSRVQHPDKPDYCLIDLDPDKGNTFKQVMETALLLKELLDDLKVPAYCKTSGATGMHIYIPLGAKYAYEQSRHLAELLVGLVHKEMPDLTSLERSPAKRKGRIYLDFLQNSETQTAAAPYSLRPRPGAPVSTPLDWSELKRSLTPEKFTIRNLPGRLRTEGDLFRPVLGRGINLDRVLKKIGSLVY
ncbi:non-homologous end-joining DNA ligase [Paraflavisolibacter sp. H34]|uniref:non-homologous end-joining DNA ligase n=1 Tax=Huijunlia imazamoxiresistens TaxID=3127457 RepID=UPI003018E06F